MITCIRDVRLAKGLTLAEVAARCDPATTAQTIGRLETGTRTVSVGWLNRIAAALGVAAADLVRLPDQVDLPVVALLGREGARAPTKKLVALAPPITPGLVAIKVEEGVGEYRAGDVLWCERVGPDAHANALNRDVLVPRPAGRFAIGRMIAREPGRVLLLPLTPGGRQMVVNDPPWIAVAPRLVRGL